MANAARLEVELGAICADVVESLNAILKRACNEHTARGRGGGDAVGHIPGKGGGGSFASMGMVVSEI